MAGEGKGRERGKGGEGEEEGGGKGGEGGRRKGRGRGREEERKEKLYDPDIPLLGIHPEELKTGTQILMNESSQQHYSQQPTGKTILKPASTDEWTNKMQSLQTRNHKRNEVLISTTCVSLKNMMKLGNIQLSESSQT